MTTLSHRTPQEKNIKRKDIGITIPKWFNTFQCIVLASIHKNHKYCEHICISSCVYCSRDSIILERTDGEFDFFVISRRVVNWKKYTISKNGKQIKCLFSDSQFTDKTRDNKIFCVALMIMKLHTFKYMLLGWYFVRKYFFYKRNSPLTYLPEPVHCKEQWTTQDLFLPTTQTSQLVHNLGRGKIQGTAWE